MKYNFDKEGFIIIRNFIDSNLVEEIKKEISNICSGRVLLDKKYIVKENDTVKYINLTDAVMGNKDILCSNINKVVNDNTIKIVSQTLKDDVRFDMVEFHDKQPGVTETPPHQDNYYFCLNPPIALTLYVALSEQSTENGGLQIVKGSHNEKTREHNSSMVKAFSSGITLSKEDEKNIVQYHLNPGDAAIHHCNIIHFANANKTDKNRKALSFRFIGSKAKYSQEMKRDYKKNRKKNRNG